MQISIFQVDAFTRELFRGNPAAVCPLNEWLSDRLMQQIAMENNLAETAFYVKKGEVFEIRWFTPTIEVDLCGHATLASANVIFNIEGHDRDIIHFHSPRSGTLNVSKQGNLFTLDFPADELRPVDITSELKVCFGERPREVLRGKTDFMFVFDSERQVRQMKPNLESIRHLNARGVIITAPGEEVDFVSRFFGPQSGIDEDPVAGSAHTSLTPYWFQRTGKKDLSAMQLSGRTGWLKCSYAGERVLISGEARLYLEGKINM